MRWNEPRDGEVKGRGGTKQKGRTGVPRWSPPRYGECLSRVNLSPEIKRSDVGPRIYAIRGRGFLVFQPCGYSVERGRLFFAFFAFFSPTYFSVVPSMYFSFAACRQLRGPTLRHRAMFTYWFQVSSTQGVSRKKLLAQILGVNNGFF